MIPLYIAVASFTDAWIETYQNARVFSQYRSHLLQMRGLKLVSLALLELVDVASFTDAWIETYTGEPHTEPFVGRIFYRCVD